MSEHGFRFGAAVVLIATRQQRQRWWKFFILGALLLCLTGSLAWQAQARLRAAAVAHNAQNRAPLPPGARAFKDLPYVTIGGHPRQKLDLYVPASPKEPLLVWIHGGGWTGGSKNDA